MISFMRVDNRLIHGQVVEAWLPHLGVNRILVADDEAAASPLTRAAMGLAVPSRVSVQISRLDGADFGTEETSGDHVLLLVREVSDAVRARRLGARCAGLNLGNIHFVPGRLQVSPSVFLSPAELEALRELAGDGVAVELRTVPKDKPLSLAEIAAKMAPPAVSHGKV